MGAVIEMNRIHPHLAKLSKPFRLQLKSKNELNWGPEQDTVFIQSKDFIKNVVEVNRLKRTESFVLLCDTNKEEVGLSCYNKN